MRHQKTRHKLSRDAAHRKALLANLCIEVIDHERIKTTEAKAKAVKPEIEQLITLARRGDLHARRQAMSTLQHPDKGVIYKLFEEIAPRYVDRPGGYTRILKLGPRRSDSTEMVYLELVGAGGGARRHQAHCRVRRNGLRRLGHPAGEAVRRGGALGGAAGVAAFGGEARGRRADRPRRSRARAGRLLRRAAGLAALAERDPAP